MRRTDGSVTTSTYNDAFGSERFFFEATAMSLKLHRTKTFFTFIHFCIAQPVYSVLMLDFVFREIRIGSIINDITILRYVIQAKYNLEKYYAI